MARERRRETRRGGRGEGPVRPAGEDRASAVTPAALLLGAGGVLIAILGFWMIARGSIALAPVLLVLAYLVLFPLALIKQPRHPGA
jgi:hypothetical protein